MTTNISLPDYYRIESVVSRSKRSTLLKATDLREDRLVAIKALNPIHWLDDSEIDARGHWMDMNQRNVAGVRGSSLAEILEVNYHAPLFYVAREWVEGASLRHLLAAGHRFSQWESALIAEQAAAAIDTLIGAGLQHGALTADNIIMTADGSIRVTDAGFARSAVEFKVAGFSVGLKPRQKPVSDLSNLAGIVYRGLTGLDPQVFGIPAQTPMELPERTVHLLRRAYWKGLDAFGTATEFSQAIRPDSKSNLLQVAWKPGAAIALLAVMATSGDKSFAQQKKTVTRNANRPIVVEQVLSNPLKVADSEYRYVQQAVLWQGTAALVNEQVAEKIGLSEDQRNQILSCLQDQRTLVRALVEVAADGTGGDPEDTMKSLRRTTEARILMVLNESQRATWDAVTRDTLPSP